ncbi:MAG TPA: hypothetical protein VJM12_16475 [Pyrinomonadaceae bacterium]|nr:hypothetical protein [Pyrinomonadaceae bacterium]
MKDDFGVVRIVSGPTTTTDDCAIVEQPSVFSIRAVVKQQMIPLVDDKQPHEIYLILGEQPDANASVPVPVSNEITV